MKHVDKNGPALTGAMRAHRRLSPEDEGVRETLEGEMDDLLEQQEWMLMRTHLKSLSGHY